MSSNRILGYNNTAPSLIIGACSGLSTAVCSMRHAVQCEGVEQQGASLMSAQQAYAELTLSAASRRKERSLLAKIYKKFRRMLRIMYRALELFSIATPLLLLYPFAREDGLNADNNAENHPFQIKEWWLQMCLRSVERAGAAVIKLMQWASSRPDLFGVQFSNVFSKLQDHTTPHAWEHTCCKMAEAYGEDWDKKVEIGEVIGSGCIGQVYKGSLLTEGADEVNEQPIAIKVMHPGVKSAIDADLELLHFAVYMVDKVPFLFKGLQWLNLNGVVDEFAAMLKLQLDFRIEAENLNFFNKNFAGDDNVSFPKVLSSFEPTSEVLLESFCAGKPIAEFVEEHKHDEKMLKSMCDAGIKTMCKMIFDHNFIHGDLHPGNILISEKDHKFIFLDAGIALEYSEADHDLIVNILMSFIRMDGERAGRLMIADSNDRTQCSDEAAINELSYVQRIKEICDAANSSDFFMDDLGHYITQIVDAGAKHHVMMNQAFVSIMLAVKVQEGVALMLSREANVMTTAIPIITQYELRRKMGQAVRT
eukprot:CAMPEP_0116042344 /NCGR_PEP_ID=MMETSP0321-20121206/25625_1 /TAXON_ID=163516 /ORGANISM="Leptocylindrus danicus var. danicus, Strain B650" /LENGTH=533 /DNA_ID=CAMNT_0003522785 /DNA_START=203 /DNA_END=1802 /DNA_ORIENTATION=+